MATAKSTPVKPRPSQTQRAIAKANAERFSYSNIYLIAYNIISALSWSFCLFNLFQHLIGSGNQSLFLIKGGSQPIINEVIKRAGTAYFKFGPVVQYVQTLALLELVHSALGLVRSGLATTAAQVASRIFMVWYVCPFLPPVAASPYYSSMIFAWSFTEVVRYSHYAAGLLGLKINLLEWLRYSTFYVLYPMGAGSEAVLVFLSAEYAQYIYGPFARYATYAILGIWPLALIYMMIHMHAQRSKHVSGGGKKSSSKRSSAQVESTPVSGDHDTPARSTRSSKKLL